MLVHQHEHEHEKHSTVLDEAKKSINSCDLAHNLGQYSYIFISEMNASTFSLAKYCYGHKLNSTGKTMQNFIM